MCIALPIRVNQQGEVDNIARDSAGYIEGLGYKTIESHLVFIHRSLRREIMVYEKTSSSCVRGFRVLKAAFNYKEIAKSATILDVKS